MYGIIAVVTAEMLLLLVHNEQKRLILQDKMDTLVNDKLTNEPLKHMVALQ